MGFIIAGIDDTQGKGLISILFVWIAASWNIYKWQVALLSPDASKGGSDYKVIMKYFSLSILVLTILRGLFYLSGVLEELTSSMAAVFMLFVLFLVLYGALFVVLLSFPAMIAGYKSFVYVPRGRDVFGILYVSALGGFGSCTAIAIPLFPISLISVVFDFWFVSAFIDSFIIISIMTTGSLLFARLFSELELDYKLNPQPEGR
ncbi:hypothetical protein [Kordiimonas pumila]|uniref:DUF4013 domain-containing protein n=1 Tax=Kordiimonas pumila TaxID=2161677 RepID=A0ABV7D5Y2_9PROT|nr:hypothetical protein [Kordiimonas pumila]